MSQNVDSMIFELRIKSSGDKEAAAKLKDIESKLKGVDLTAARMSASLALANRSRALDGIADQAQRGEISTRRMTEELHKLGATSAEIDRVANSLERATRATAQGGSAAAGGGLLNTARGAAGAAGGVLSTAGAGTAGAAVGSILNLTAVLGPMGAAAGLATVAIGALNAETQRQTELVTARVNAEKETARLIAEATRETLTATRDATITELAQLQADLDIIKNTPITVNPDSILGLLTGNFLGGGENKGLTALQIETEAAIAATEVKLEQYNVALDENVTATNDALEATRQLSEAQVSAADFMLQVDKMTEQQREQRIAQNERDVNVLTRLIGAGGLSEDALQELADQITDLNDKTAALSAVSESYADQLAREQLIKENATQRTEQIIDLVNQEVAAREKIFAINQEIAAIEAKRDEDMLKVISDYNEKIADLNEDAGDRRVELAQDSADRILRIERDSGRALRIAIGERDAYAYKQAAEQRADALDDESKAHKKQLANLEANLKKQIDAADKAQRTQLVNLQNSATREINTKRAGLQAQEHIISTSMTSQAFLASNGAAKVVSEHAKMYTSLEGAAYVAGKRIVEAFMIGAGQQPIGGIVGGKIGGGGLGIGVQRAIEKTIDQRLAAYVR